MSVPRERLDQLLSGYLDDVLSEEEKTQVDTLLRDDPEVVRELEELRRLRGSLRDISRTDASVRLDDGFADRVLRASVEQAQSEGVSDNHPLIKLSEQPSTTAKQRVRWIPIAGGILTLAASIAVAIVVLQSSVDDGSANLAVVQDQPSEMVSIASSDMKKIDDFTPEHVPDSTDVIDEPPVKDMTQAVVRSETPTKSDLVAIAPETVKDPKATARESVAEVAAPAIGTSGSANIFVLNVKRTEEGRLRRSVRDAMKLSSIKAAEEKQLSDKMVGFVGKSIEKDNQSNDSVQVIYLESSSKRIDVLVNRLVADEVGIESVGLGLSVSAPIRRVVQAINPAHATTVRHDASWDLQGDAMNTLADALSSRSFLPMKNVNGLPLTMPANSDGPDELSQVLILIR